MSIVTGLKGIRALMDANENRGGEDFVKTVWFGLKDKQAARVVFLQELDEDAKGFSSKNGLGRIVVEHNNPKNFKRKAECTLESEGACWACEQHRKDWKAGWGQKQRLYINALATYKGEDPQVVVLSQGLSGKQVTPQLVEQAELFGTITAKEYQIKRQGSGLSDTTYLLTALEPHDLDVESYELFDLDGVVRKVPYADQSAHYLDNATGESGAEAASESANSSSEAASADDEW
jgi:hypothetical protein